MIKQPYYIPVIRTLYLSISIILVSSIVCNSQLLRISNAKSVDTKGFNEEFSEYCEMSSSQGFERNAVVSSFFGDHRRSIAFATKDAVPIVVDNPTQVDTSQTELIKNHFIQLIADSSLSTEERSVAQKMLNILERPTNVEEVFKGSEIYNARDFIVEDSKHYHFLLINEAHYSSQNRAFTHSFLEPLWDQGYRYLALETLGYEDTSLMQRGYPVMSTGYYTRDPVFGNLVRDALEIGYKLISYETTNDHDGTLMDYDQAVNIYQKTWQKDTVGKVLVHAGYSHIGESGSETYNPMGSQLKELSGQDILTVEQQTMTELTDDSLLHPYYQYAINHYEFEAPVVFIKNDQTLIDLVNTMLVDIQVYHPRTEYVDGRPSWLLDADKRRYELPKEFEDYEGHLLQVVPLGENTDAIPVDQFVITSEKKLLILPPGEYTLRVIDCEGTLVGKSDMSADQ